MNDRERLLELLTSMQRDLMPSLIRMHDSDDLRMLDNVMLQVLARHGAPTVKELAALVGRSLSRTSRIVDGLVRRGLAERYEDQIDRRMRRIRISEEGAAVLRRVQDVRMDAQMTLWNRMTEDEQKIVLQSMEIYAKAARRIRDESDPAV
ncbi:MarR family transcriptional regulator [Spongiactinospora sp. TRM90649]|uniref:MarR family winged helix-turn-helix transcriptional regulator n=1 Tax=Spongiactinospora sp. TRM90649 TaxID=3031114 RepID=UPI0023F7D304|nr:MarR family transcriptional regulator [Spongiactinospora sp. TRM90649]MDF5751010.1 MarR family transcriptional regulator [Spongiactinospora sp. TRM90649]